jgi:hypothetical protein
VVVTRFLRAWQALGRQIVHGRQPTAKGGLLAAKNTRRGMYPPLAMARGAAGQSWRP